MRKTAQAEEDLIEIWRYVAYESPAAADRLLDGFEEKWWLLATQPSMGAGRNDIAPGIRHLVIGNYLTLYRVVAGEVEIVRVMHGRRSILAEDIALPP